MRVTHGDSDMAIVAFSARGAYPKPFQFLGLERAFPDASRIFVRDRSDRWYNAGLPGVGDTVEAIATRLRAELERAGAKRTIAVGPSMGGYAAILFGCLIGAQRTIALAPQTLLHPGLPERVPAAAVPLQVPDLEPIVRAAPQTEVDVVVAWQDTLDVFHAQRIAHLASVRILGVMGADHNFARSLLKQGEFWPFMTGLIEGRPPEICVVDPPLQPAMTKRIAAALADWGLGNEALGKG